jgi:hypothetical protein
VPELEHWGSDTLFCGFDPTVGTEGHRIRADGSAKIDHPDTGAHWILELSLVCVSSDKKERNKEVPIDGSI